LLTYRTGTLAARDGGTTGIGLNQTVPVPAQGRVSEVGSGRDRSYRVKMVVAARAATTPGGGAVKNTPIMESLPV
jgi:hypothetical protein